MHLITALVTIFSLLALTFAGPIIPTPPADCSVTSTHKPSSWTGDHSYTHYSFPTHKSEIHHTGPHTFSRPTGTYETHHHSETHSFPHHTGTHEVHHSGTHTGTHSFTRPTGTHTFSHYTGTHTLTQPTGTYTHRKPAGSPAVQRRVAEAESVNDPELFVRAGLEGDELADALNARDGSAVDGGCTWECFQITCECVNAGGKSVLISKTLAGLALIGAAAAVLV